MMTKSVGSNKSGLLRSVLEKASFKEEEKKKKLIPYLHGDFISNILTRLPIESLRSSMFVCKPWYDLISSLIFVDAHLHQSESVLIFQAVAPKAKLHPYSATSMPLQQQNTFSLEERLLRPITPAAPLPSVPAAPLPCPWLPATWDERFFIHCVECKEGKNKIREYNISCRGHIIASCNGLILLENKLKTGGLVVMNPITRKLTAFPAGTLSSPRKESYGFAFNDATGEYKVVHLFIDKLGFTNCEILNLETRIWREVNGPASGLIRLFGDPPVSAIGALHWLPRMFRNPSNYIVSMGMDDENFYTKNLPKICRACDKIIEMHGCLSFVTHEGSEIDIWNLRSLRSSDWTRQYRIRRGAIPDAVPSFSLRISGDLIFRRSQDCSFYAYDFKEEKMREVETDNKIFFVDRVYPHVNSLVSWTRSKKT